jgi:hypothetical protein
MRNDNYAHAACCMQNTLNGGAAFQRLVGSYSLVAAFAQDVYIDRSSGEDVNLASAFTSYSLCSNVTARLKIFVRAREALIDIGVSLARQGTDAAIYQILPPEANTFVVAFRGSEMDEDFAADWMNTDAQGLPQLDKVCPTNTYKGPLWLLDSDYVHLGFQTAYLSVQSDIRGFLLNATNSRSTIYVTGHSLGGSLATLCGYDLTCNQIHSVTPQIITMAAPAVFKDTNHFEHIVSSSHYLRVIAEAGDKDIVTTSMRSMAYFQPSYPYLRIDPNFIEGKSLNCLAGECHVLDGPMINEGVLAAPIFHTTCAALAECDRLTCHNQSAYAPPFLKSSQCPLSSCEGVAGASFSDPVTHTRTIVLVLLLCLAGCVMCHLRKQLKKLWIGMCPSPQLCSCSWHDRGCKRC